MVHGATGRIDHAGNATAKDSGRPLEGEVGIFSVPLIGIGHGDQGHDGQHALNQHTAVSNGFRMGLLIQLLGGSAGSDQGMKTGNSAAGDGGE